MWKSKTPCMDSRLHCHTKGLVRLNCHINKQLVKLIFIAQNFCFEIPVQKAVSISILEGF